MSICVEITFYGAFVLIVASSSTPSTRRLLDGVAMPVPHRSHGAPDTLVDFHTGCKRMSWQALDWFVCGVLVVMGRERYAIDATRHSCEHRNTPALDFYKALGANRLDSWVNLRLGEKELTQLLGIS